MKYLFVKMQRDLLKMWTQFFSVFMMAFLGVLIYVAMEGMWFGMGSQLETIYEEANLSNAWAYGYGIEQKDIDEIEKFKEVNEVAPAMTVSMKVRDKEQELDLSDNEISDNSSEVKVIASDNNSLSGIRVNAGQRFHTQAEGIWLDKSYADARGYKVGDLINLEYEGLEYKTEILGLILHPEYIYYTGSVTAYTPQHSKFGYGVINEKTASKIFKDVRYNELRLSTKEGFNSENLQTKIEDILEDKYIGYADQETLTGVSNPLDKVEQIKKMSIMFSLLFILLAMLTMQTTMTRLVANQRIQIGTFKAVGFGSGAILLHYALYALVVSLLGGLLGVILAPKLITPVLMSAIKSTFVLPSYEPQITWMSYGVAVAVAICCTITTVFACRKDLKGMPAETMRGAKTKAKGKILLERIGFLWEHISFGTKWSIRDIARNKVRTIMGIVGVFGCMMLIIAGLGMQNTLNYANEYVYETQYTYGSKIVLGDMTATEDKEKLESQVEGTKQWIMESTIELKNKEEKKSGYLTVLESGEFIHLENTDGVVVKMPREGAGISRKIAEQLNVSVGDTISFRLPREKDYTDITIVEVLKSPSPQGIFLSQKAFEKLGKEYTSTSLLSEQTNLSEDITTQSFVGEHATIAEQYNSANEVTRSVATIFILMIAGAILLGVVILYNLGILSYTERIREYATLKVLGFYQKEISVFALKENVMTSVIGWLIGIPVGLWFLRLYVSIVSIDSFDWVAKLSMPRFLVATVITVGCSIGVSFFLSLKVKKINMVEALKSVE